MGLPAAFARPGPTAFSGKPRSAMPMRCVVADGAGMLVFRDVGGTPVVTLPASAFQSILWGDEEEPET